jgi:DNA polymerase V
VAESVRLYTPTADTGRLCSQLVQMLQRSFKVGLEYHRADVVLYDLVPETGLQTDLFGSVDIAGSMLSHGRMQALDSINRRYGKSTIRFAAEDLSRAWQPRKKLSSPRYTSAWAELPEAKLV